MNIFGIGVPELLFILILGFLVIGPERLPQIARSFGRFVARVLAWQQTSPEIRMFQSIRQDFQKEIQEVREELVRTQQRMAESANVFQQQSKNVLENVSDLAVDPTKHARDQQRRAATAVSTSRPNRVNSQNGANENETVQNVSAEDTNEPNGQATPATDEQSSTLTTENQPQPTTEIVAPDTLPEPEPTLADIQAQMHYMFELLHTMHAQFEAKGLLDAEWNPRMQIQLLMQDVYALQQQLQQKGFIDKDWKPPSHSTYTHHTSV